MNAKKVPAGSSKSAGLPAKTKVPAKAKSSAASKTAAQAAEAEAEAPDAAAPKRPGPNPKGGRVSAEEGGGTGAQNDRRRDLRARFAEEFHLAKRNPQFRFKSAKELGVDFRVNEKTIRTDIKFLQIVEGLPIDDIKPRGGWGFTEEVKAFEGEEFTRGEYVALWLSVQSLEAWGGLPHQKKMPSLMRKLRATSAMLDPGELKRMRQYVTFKAGGFQAPVDQGVFDVVMRAVLRREELDFGYLSLTQRRAAVQCPPAHGERGQRPPAPPSGLPPVGPGASVQTPPKGIFAPSSLVQSASVLSWATAAGVTPERRRVQPLHLLCWEYAWYLFAWDYDRKDIRTFALGRMSDVESAGVRFEPAVRFNLRKELSKSFGITRGLKAVPVHLRFQSRAIPLIIERLWHPSQEMIENEDATLDLTMQVAVTPELIRWVQSWGSDCAVHAPESLDDEVLEEARKKLQEAAKRRGLRWVIG